MKAFIIGCGGVALAAAKSLCAGGFFEEIMIAGRELNKCDALKFLLEREGAKIKILTDMLDAEDSAETSRLMNDFSPDVAMNLATPRLNLKIMDACLETGANYLDAACYRSDDAFEIDHGRQRAYMGRFIREGITALTGCGVSPGITGVIAAYAQKNHFDKIHYIDVLYCKSADGGREGRFAADYNAEVFFSGLTGAGRYYEGGRRVETEPFEIIRDYYFENAGRREIYLTSGEDADSLSQNIQGVGRVRFFTALDREFIYKLRLLRDAGMTSVTPVEYEGRKIVPLRFLSRAIADKNLGSGDADDIASIYAGCVFRGIKNGEPKNYRANIILTDYDAVRRAAGISAAAGALLIACGAWKRPGVYNAEEFDPDPFMSALTESGIYLYEDFSPELID